MTRDTRIVRVEPGRPVLGETIPALPVKQVAASSTFYREKLGFAPRHQEEGFAIVRRDAAEIHLWQANDEEWRERANLADRPVASGAESFLAGTASCRVRVEGIDQLYAEYQTQGVVHPRGLLKEQWWGDRDFSVLDLDGNLVTFFQPGTTTGSAE
jgi:catechol 2,3-dioxygenase-like lactoylglutathione lyase family enzyme